MLNNKGTNMKFEYENKYKNLLLIISLIAFAIIIRVFLFYIPSPDIQKFNSVWYDTFIKIGRIDAFKTIFYNYAPSYLYLVDIATLSYQIIPKDIAIKLIPVIFDFFAAFSVFKIISKISDVRANKWVGFFATLFTPTIFIESGMWGQADIIYASFLLYALYLIFEDKPVLSFFFFSIAFCFKLQALFFAPIYIILLFRKKIPFWSFLILPLTYIVSILPATICGAPFTKLLTMYFTQIDYYNSLSMRAPNFYIFISSDPHYEIKVITGLILTLLVVCWFLFFRIVKWKDNGIKSMLFDLAFFTTIIPFLLPKMHERYFFLSSIFLLLLCLYDNRYFILFILIQSSSVISFIPYFSGWSDNFVKIGAILNVALIFLLIHFYADHINEQKLSISSDS